MDGLEKEIMKLLHEAEKPRRTATSSKYPFLKKQVIFLRQMARNVKNFLDYRVAFERKEIYFSCTIARHQSVLRRKLGDSDPELQERKIINLKQAIRKLNGVIIKPGNIFSFWHIVGRPEYENGYVDGMLLSNGQVTTGVGGGLCQLSNFLYWIFLHSQTEISERHHHSVDVFPDSGRTLPFGSGATIYYNYVDLKVKNISPNPIQLKIWLTNNHLKGSILSTFPAVGKHSILEKNHYFIKKDRKYFRYNEIFRNISVNGKTEKVQKIDVNFAPVLYNVTDEYLRKNNFNVLDFTGKSDSPD